MSEYIGLFRLHALTLDIQRVYSLGAEVTVASDGAVFNGKSLIDSHPFLFVMCLLIYI